MKNTENEQASTSLPGLKIRYSTFGKRLKQIRKERHLTQSQLAEMLGTSKQVISRYEHGESNPKIELVCKYAEILEVAVDYLLKDDVSAEPINEFYEKVTNKPFYKIFIEVTADYLGLDIPGVVQKTGLTDREVRMIITRQMKVATLPLARRLSATLNVPLGVWDGTESYVPADVSLEAYEVARNYDKADIRDKNWARMALKMEPLKEETV